MSFADIQGALEPEDKNPLYYKELVKEWEAGNFYILYGMQQNTEQKPMYKALEEFTPSRHLAVIFNMFVFM
jgi:hypothetical protein